MKELIKMGTSGLYLDFSQHKKRNFVVVLCFLQLVLILMSNFIIVNKLFNINEMKEFSRKWSKYSLWTNFFQFFRWLAARLRDKLTNQKTAFNPWPMGQRTDLVFDKSLSIHLVDSTIRFRYWGEQNWIKSTVRCLCPTTPASSVTLKLKPSE